MTRQTKFGQLLAYPLRSGVTVPKGSREHGIRMVNMGELFRYPRLFDASMARVNIDVSNSDRVLLQEGDLLFARRSLTLEGAGKCSIVKGVSEPTTWESSIIRARLDRSVANPDYLYYYFSSPQGRRQISTIVEQVAAAGIRLTELRDLEVPTPLLGEQRAIAEVLGALDDKIAANAALASSVDALLAVRFEELAGDCDRTELASIATVNETSVRARASGQLRYLDIASVAIGRYDFPNPMPWADAPGRARRAVRSGDTVWSTVRPNRRSHALVLDQDPDLIASTGLAVITPKNGRFACVYEATRLPEFTAFLESVAEGSAYPAVRGDRFLSAPVPELSDEVQEAFECLAAPLRRRSHSAVVESRFLAELRDALLPGLMSGRIRVKDVESVVGEAV